MLLWINLTFPIHNIQTIDFFLHHLLFEHLFNLIFLSLIFLLLTKLLNISYTFFLLTPPINNTPRGTKLYPAF